jgi:hypothetical protein
MKSNFNVPDETRRIWEPLFIYRGDAEKDLHLMPGEKNTKIIKKSSLLVLLMLWGALGAGCQTQHPTSAQLPASTSSAPNMVIDFEGSPATLVNPFLAEAGGTPNNVIYTAGSVGDAGDGTTTLVVPGGADNTAYSLHVSGPVTAPTNQLQLTIQLDTGNPTHYYDASLFKGVKFYLKVADDDNTSPKFFSIPIAQTMLSGNKYGTCQNGCYDHFGYNFASTNGKWQLLALDFSSLKRAGWGSAVTPSTLSGTNLQQVVQLQQHREQLLRFLDRRGRILLIDRRRTVNFLPRRREAPRTAARSRARRKTWFCCRL